MIPAEEGAFNKITGKIKSKKSQSNDNWIEKFTTSDGKEREIYWQDKYKTDMTARQLVRSYVDSQIKMIIKNEEKLLDMIYQENYKDGPGFGILDRDEDYFEYFEIYEGENESSKPQISPYTAYNQMYLKSCVNGKATPKDVEYQD
jgi:hypothetical protein